MSVYQGADWVRVRIGLRVAHARKVGRSHPESAQKLLADADRLVRELPFGDRQGWEVIVLELREALRVLR